MDYLSFRIPQMMLYQLCKNFISDNLKYNDRSIIHPYEIDIFIPDYKIAFLNMMVENGI
jgi:hypothetical protein